MSLGAGRTWPDESTNTFVFFRAPQDADLAPARLQRQTRQTGDARAGQGAPEKRSFSRTDYPADA